jgi:hypothetical protein
MLQRLASGVCATYEYKDDSKSSKRTIGLLFALDGQPGEAHTLVTILFAHYSTASPF